MNSSNVLRCNFVCPKPLGPKFSKLSGHIHPAYTFVFWDCQYRRSPFVTKDELSDIDWLGGADHDLLCATRTLWHRIPIRT